MIDFNDSAATGERTLYHCLYREPDGEALLPTCEREVNGVEGHYLFAASHLSKALAFAFSYHDDKGEIICNGGIEGTNDEFAIICSASRTLNAAKHIRVYSFSSKNFEMAWGPESRQYVSMQPVRFADAELVLETEDINDLMERGLHIFSTEKSRETLRNEGFKPDFQMTTPQWLHHLVQNEGFISENKQRGLKMNAALVCPSFNVDISGPNA